MDLKKAMDVSKDAMVLLTPQQRELVSQLSEMGQFIIVHSFLVSGEFPMQACLNGIEAQKQRKALRAA